MTFRKNRLVLLAAIGILSKWVMEERRKVLSGAPESEMRFRRNESANNSNLEGTIKNTIKKGIVSLDSGIEKVKETIKNESGESNVSTPSTTTYSTTYSKVDENNSTEAIDVFNNKVEILSIEKTKEENGISANDGYEFYKIRTKFTNGTNEEVKVSYSDFNLESELGSQRKVLDNTYFEEKIVNPREAIEGILVYEVPMDSKNLDLSFSVGGSLSRTKIKIK